MNKNKLKTGIQKSVSYYHLLGRLDSEALLESLGIDISYRRGSQIMCHCPNLTGNHSNGDQSPSFGFNEDKLAYNCFVCGGGTPIQLVQMFNDMTDDEALHYLEQFADGNQMTSEDLLQKIQQIMNSDSRDEPMPDYPDDALFRYRKIHPYLYDRGLTKDVIVDMQVGFDESHAGITIPHYFQGVLRGWQTRHLAVDKNGDYMCEHESCNVKKRVPKYKNTTGFPKVNTLYGYDRMKQKLQENNPEDPFVIVVESPMTALKLMSQGFDYVVATFGQFSREQGMLLIPMRRVYFWPDNDQAGYENAERCIDSLGRYTTVYIVPAVPKPKGDAADLESEQVQAYLDEAYLASLFPMLSQGSLKVFPNTNL